VVERYRNEELANLLGPHDLNLLPTLSEGFPGTLLEAMARGLPSVVTATPGTDAFCHDGVNALVVPPADATAIHDALQRLIASPPLRERLSRAAVVTARERTWPRVAALNLDIYERGLARKRAPSAAEPSGGRR
jgi:glycosyltransferase involved in cell wall biosynthesis